MNVLCSKATKGDYDYQAQGDTCHPEVNLVSKMACPVFSTSEMWEYIYKYRYYWGGPLILIGLLLCFVGRYLIRPSVCFAGFLSSIAIAMLIFYAVYLQDTTNMQTFAWVFGTSAILGCCLGIVLAVFVKVGAALLAGWGGFALGMVLMSSVFATIGSPVLFWIVVCVSALICAVLCFFFYDVIVIVATCGLGAYATIRGIAVYGGHYYNEFLLEKMIKDGLVTDIDPIYWVYVASMFVLLVAGLIA